MNILDQINQDYDGVSPPPMGTDGVDVSTNGTVTLKLRHNSKPAIPGSFVDPNQVIVMIGCVRVDTVTVTPG